MNKPAEIRPVADQQKIPVHTQQNMALNFLLGGISGCIATLSIQPLDMIKVRIQLLSEMGQKRVNMFKVAGEIVKKDGICALYKGLDSALARQIIYGTTRLGLFYSFLDYFKRERPEPTILQKSVSSFVAGGIASIVANPADLILVRMQADGALPPAQRRNYKNVFDGIVRIIKEEGFTKLWRGCIPTIARASILNLSLLAPFEEFKVRLKNVIKDTTARTMVSSMLASLIGSLSALPFDNAKTKLQKMKPNENGVLPYCGIVDCMIKTVRTEGLFKLWVGLPTFYIRIGPHVIITLMMNDFLRSKLLKKHH